VSAGKGPSSFGAAHATLAYVVVAIWLTWPLARGLTHDVAWDLGDPVLVIWALAWNCSQLLAILGGDLSRIGTYFDANIFSPAPLTLAYSEHFFAQSVQMLPVYAATGNAILGYNLLYLSTFVLSGTGAFLFVRELTGSRTAAFTAGLLFAFAPYRIPQSSHLQVLSAQWMPFALYGFRRYFETGRRWALAGAAAALVVENLSCGYYLLYFSPFAAAYVLAELGVRGLWRRPKTWIDLGIAAIAVLAVTVPFFVPYLALRAQMPSTRSLDEVRRYSADIYSYLTAFAEQPLWGRLLQAFPRPEGQLFPGVAGLLLALVALIPRRPAPDGAGAAPAAPRVRAAIAILAALALVHAAALIYVLFERRLALALGPLSLQASNATQLLLRATILGSAAVALSPSGRKRARAWAWPRGAILAGLLAACWLSLGPSPTSSGRPLDLASPYRVLYDLVPGFDGVRVPSRFWMIGTLALATLAGFGAARLQRRRGGLAVLVAVLVLAAAEARVDPFTVNGAGPVPGYVAPESRIRGPGDVPPIYRAVATQPSNAVLAELPLGVPDFDVRAMYYSTFHWRKILNGYSGFTPAHYGRLVVASARAAVAPDETWEALREAKASLVLVHEGAYAGGAGAAVTAAFVGRGARVASRDGPDVLLTLP
jgi:hypothetical protein